MADCGEIIRIFSLSQDNKDILSSCLQSIATIQAGKIQAKAATLAGGLTFLASMTAIISAAIAYLSAKRQVKLTEDRDKVKVFAYKTHLSDACNTLSEEMQGTHFAAVSMSIERKHENAVIEEEDLLIYLIALEFEADNWDNHSMLTENELFLIREIRQSLKVFNGCINNFNRLVRLENSERNQERTLDALENIKKTMEYELQLTRDLFESLRRKPDLPKGVKDLKNMVMPLYTNNKDRNPFFMSKFFSYIKRFTR